MQVDLRAGLSKLHEAAQIALDCAEPAFKVFLHEVHGCKHPMTDDDAVAWTMNKIGARTPSEINTNEASCAQWAALRASFKNWKES